MKNTRFIASILLLGLAAGSSASAESAPDAWRKLVGERFASRPEFAFVQNRPELPNVLIYGDSISIGYTKRVREQMKDRANVYRLHVNGNHSGMIVKLMREMHAAMRDPALDKPWTFEWDVIQFNVGLHDLKYVSDKGLDKVNGKQVSTIELYQKNLHAAVAYLKELAPTATLVFATTTPVPEGSKGRIHGDAATYNLAALTVMAKYPEIVINDLYGFTKPHMGDWPVNPRNVHFKPTGTNAQGDEVARVITKALERGNRSTVAMSKNAEQTAFEEATAGDWREVFADSCTGDWQKQWFLDGEIGTVKTGPDGMTLTAGPEFKNDAHHMVLWTKDSFEGDLKIEYDYTRLDSENRCVNILYIQATGSGEGPYAKDIAEWRELRKVPAMRTYFNNMNTYHISYAAFGNDGTATKSYIRGRRYMPHKTGLKGSDLEPDYYFDDLFEPGVKHHMTVIKRDRDLFVRVENPDGVTYCRMHNAKLPIVTEGRVGLRHMFTRSSRYQNIEISQRAATTE